MSSENNVTVGLDVTNVESVSESISLLSNGEAQITTTSSRVSTTRPFTHYERLKRFCDEHGIEYKEGTTDGSYFHESERQDIPVPTKYIDLSAYTLTYGVSVVHFRESDGTFFGIEAE